jgi:hypothetical protein
VTVGASPEQDTGVYDSRLINSHVIFGGVLKTMLVCNVQGHRRRGEHQTIPTSTRHSSTNMDPIQAAIETYESREPGENTRRWHLDCEVST